MAYYKVVKPNLQSAWVDNSELITQYKVGEFVNPKYSRCKLLCFNTLLNAKNFRNNWCDNSYPIYECEVKNPKTKGFVPYIEYHSFNKLHEKYSKLDNIQLALYLLKNKEKCIEYFCKRLSNGTIFCDAIKLIGNPL